MFRRHPLVKQYDSRDCGPAALASVALHYGVRIPQARLRELALTDLQGTDLARLREAAERLGFLANAGKAKPNVLDKIPLPAVVHIRKGEHQDLDHYLVVYHVTAASVEIGDPAEGVSTMKRAEFEKLWTGGLLLIGPTDHIEQRKEKGGPGSRLLGLVLQHRSDLLTALGCAAVATILGMATSFFLQLVVDRVLPRGDTSLLTLLVVAMVGIVLFRSVYSLLRSVVIIHLGRRIELQQGLGYAQHLLSLSMRFFDTHVHGDVISRLMDIQRIRSAVGGVALAAVMDAALMVVAAIVLFFYHPALAALTLALVPVLAAVTYLQQKPIVRSQEKLMRTYSQLNTRFVDAAVEMRMVKGFTAEREIFRKIEEDYLTYTDSVNRAQQLSLWGQILAGAVTMGGTAIVLYAGAREAMAGQLTPGQLLFFFSMVGYLLGPAERLAGSILSLQEAIVSMDRLDEILMVHPERADSPGRRIDLTGAMELKDVTFGYEPSTPVVKNVSLSIPVGSTLALVGETGSGKTTLASLLCGFYVPQSGRITFDGQDLRDLDLTRVREQMAVVFQDNYLISGTIRENLRLARPDVTTEEIDEALKLALAADFVRALPKGLDYDTGPQGHLLSSGQRQRLAIARALARGPKILILDEATSNLDSSTEAAVVASLRDETRTTIVIAHRLSTVRLADRIVVLDKGQVIEQGSHDELIGRNGKYAELWGAYQTTSERRTDAPTP